MHESPYQSSPTARLIRFVCCLLSTYCTMSASLYIFKTNSSFLENHPAIFHSNLITLKIFRFSNENPNLFKLLDTLDSRKEICEMMDWNIWHWLIPAASIIYNNIFIKLLNLFPIGRAALKVLQMHFSVIIRTEKKELFPLYHPSELLCICRYL